MLRELFAKLFTRDNRPRPDERGKRPPVRPRVELLEDRWLLSNGLLEYTVPTSSSSPFRITPGPGDGNLWFTEQAGNKIGKITTAGSFTEYTVPTASSSPYGIVAGPDGNVWFTESAKDKVGKVTTAGTFTEYALTAGRVPHGITVGPDGNLWFTESGAAKIASINPTTGTVTEYALPTNYNTPDAITTGVDGNLWFVDKGPTISPGFNNYYIAKSTPAGTMTEYATNSSGSVVNDIVSGPDGNLWFTNGSPSYGLSRITTAGVMTGFSSSGGGTKGLAPIMTPGSTLLWYTGPGGNIIGRGTTGGATTTVATLPSGSDANGWIAVGADGHAWFTELNDNKIGTLDWPLTGAAVQNDPFQSYKVPIDGQPGSWYTPGAGTLHVEVPLNFAQGDCNCGASALAYNSDSIAVRPVVSAVFGSEAGDPVPSTLKARLTWNNGTSGSWVTFSTSGRSSGDAYAFALQVGSAVTATGVYAWKVEVQATLPDTTVITRDLSGYLPLVVNDGTTTDPFGPGWSVGLVDSLVDVPAATGVPKGKLYVSGFGQARFFQDVGNGAYLDPPNDFGTLAAATVGGVTTYTYTGTHQRKYTFNSSGQLVTITDPHSLTTTFSYSSGRLSTVAFYDGGLTTFIYTSGLLTEVDEPGGPTVLVRHDGTTGDVTGVNNANNSLRTFTYDGSHHLTGDQWGPRLATYAYDATAGVLTTITVSGNELLNLLPAWLQESNSGVALAAPIPNTITDSFNRTTTLTLDTLGRLLHAATPDGAQIDRPLDFAGNPTNVTDPLGRTTTYAYQYGSGLGDLTGMTFPNGTSEQFQYDTTFHKPTVEVDALGNRTTMAYDAVTGDLLTSTDAQSHVTTYAYYQSGGRSNGLVLSVTDADGNITSYAYDSARRVTQEINGYGTASASTITMIYDSAGNLLSETTGQSTTAAYAHAVTSSYAYDAMRRVTAIIDAYGTAQQRTTTYLYDAVGAVLSLTDPLGHVISYGYDAAGRTTTEIDAYGTAVARTATMIYDVAGNLLSETTGQSTTAAYAHAATTSYAYDGLNRITRVIVGYGTARAATTTILYDAAGNELSVTDPNGAVVSYGYDSLNRLVNKIDGYGTAAASTATFLYDSAGNLLSETIGQSTTAAYAHVSTTSYGYDALNRMVKKVVGYGTAGATTVTMIYDTAGNLLSETTGQSTTAAYANVSTTSFAYDAKNRRIAEIDAYGVTGVQRTLTTVYDAASNVVASIDPLGNATTLAYDALNRITGQIDPLSNLSTTVYDAANNVVNRIDANGDKTTYAYDALDRLTTATDARGGLTTVAYDAVGDRLTLTDPDGNVTTTAYDVLRRMTQQTDPLNHTGTYAYDLGGRLTSTTDALGSRRDLTFDALNRQTGETWTVSGSTTNALTYTYDAAGNQLTAADQNGAYTMAYDALNRMTSEQEPFGLALTFSYDAASNRVLVQDSLNGVATSVYDALGRLTSRQFGGAGQTPLHETLTWNARNQLATASRYNDQSGSTLVGASSYVYDAVGRTTSIQHKDGSANVLASYAYSYDSGSRLTSQTVDGVNTTFSYDKTDQLTQAGSATYGYDAAGNRTNTGYQTGTGDQMTNDGTWTYTYDAAGQLIKKSKGASAETWTYGYDLRGHLAWAKDAATDGGAATTLATYVYDVKGNLIEEDVWTQASGATAVTRYGYDGANAWADLNGSNALVMRRLFLDGADQPFARIDSGGTAAWYLADRQGSIRDVVNLAGTTVLDHLAYDGFGNVTSESNAAAGDAYKYNGGRLDAATGYTLFGWRYYDAATGRWTTRDPSGFSAGDSNLYRYVGNGPTNGSDPSGLDIRLYEKAIAGAYGHAEVVVFDRECGTRMATYDGSGPGSASGSSSNWQSSNNGLGGFRLVAYRTPSQLGKFDPWPDPRDYVNYPYLHAALKNLVDEGDASVEAAKLDATFRKLIQVQEYSVIEGTGPNSNTWARQLLTLSGYSDPNPWWAPNWGYHGWWGYGDPGSPYDAYGHGLSGYWYGHVWNPTTPQWGLFSS
jgi:RHS repeat-associated protein